MSMRAQLAPLEGGPPIEIVKDMTLVGRQDDCDVCLDHKSVSKLHCVIVKTDGVLLLRDLGSTNGTRVNGTRIRRAVLLPNDKLSIANFHYRVLFGAALLGQGEPDRTQRLDPRELEMAGDPPPGGSSDEALAAGLGSQTNSLPDLNLGDAQKKADEDR